MEKIEDLTKRMNEYLMTSRFKEHAICRRVIHSILITENPKALVDFNAYTSRADKALVAAVIDEYASKLRINERRMLRKAVLNHPEFRIDMSIETLVRWVKNNDVTTS